MTLTFFTIGNEFDRLVKVVSLNFFIVKVPVRLYN